MSPAATPDPFSSDFVGAERRAVLTELLDIYEDVVAAGSTAVVSLEAPRGWGKTRLVHEFYATLAARPGQSYWPLRLLEADARGSRTRHVVYPSRAMPPDGAVLPWMWWGISCHLRPDGQPAQVLADAITQVEAHGAPLLEAAAARGTIRRAGSALGLALLGIAVPVVGTASAGVDAATALWQTIRASVTANRQRIAADIDPDAAERLDLVDRSLAVAAAARAADVPLVLIVDDAHRADRSLVNLIRRLVEADEGSVLIVSTAWPDELARGGEGSFGAFLRERQQAQAVFRRPLDRLPRDDLSRLVLSEAPATDVQVVAALAARADGNPLVLRGLLETRRAQRQTRDGRIELSADEVARLPNSYRGQLEERWRDLEEPVREAFAIAALQGREFLDDLVRVATDALGWGDDPAAVIADVADRLSWIGRLERFYVFQELYLVELAQQEVREILAEDEVQAVLLQMGRSIQESLDHARLAWIHLPPRLAGKLMELDVRLALEAPGLRPRAFESALQLSMILASRGADEDAELWIQSAVEFAASSEDRTRAAGIRAVLLSRLGRNEEALEVLMAEREALEDGTTDAALIDKQIAEALLEQGDLEQAEGVARRTLLAEDPWAQQALTEVFIRRGDFEGAAAHQRSILERLGADDMPSTVGNAHFKMADLLHQLGREEDALHHARIAAEILEERFGDSGHETLRARELAGIALMGLNRAQEAREVLSAVVAGYAETGDRWRLSRLAAQSELARAILKTGDPEAAKSLFVELLQAWRDATDPAHANVALTQELINRCEALMTHRVEVRDWIVAGVRGGDAADVLADARDLVSTSRTQPLDEQLHDLSLLSGVLWHAGRAEEAVEVSQHCAAVARGHKSDRRRQRELERLEAWLAGGRSGLEMPDSEDVGGAVRGALLVVASRRESSPILEMAILDAVRLAVREDAGLAADGLAAAAVTGVILAGERLLHGYPSFA
ncbi:MAG: AAA family ATPase, partial [Solirubrobacterales bacterium]|nr:AAA family ATPase [Solirubrobacterales bacterium]